MKDPERTIPRSTIIGTLAATIVSTVAIMGIIPAADLAQSTSPFADAAGAIFGGNWEKIIAAVAMVGTFGALNGWILLQGRVPSPRPRMGCFPGRLRG